MSHVEMLTDMQWHAAKASWDPANNEWNLDIGLEKRQKTAKVSNTTLAYCSASYLFHGSKSETITL